MVNINEVAPTFKLFEDVPQKEKLDKDKKKEVIGKELEIERFAILKGDDGIFTYVLATVEGRKVYLALSEMLLERLQKAYHVMTEEVANEEEKEYTFPESVKVKLGMVKTKNGRDCYVFEE